MKKNLLLILILSISISQAQQDDFAIPAEAPDQISDPVSQQPAIDTLLQDPTVSQSPAFTVPQGFDPALEGFFEDLNYTPQDKRDPFLPFLVLQKIKIVNEKQETTLEPLQEFALNELKVVGIIWDVGKPKALVVDPKGKSHIITESSKLGKDFGYVAAIREGEVIVIEEQFDTNSRRTFVTKILKISNSAGIDNTRAQ